MDDQEFEEKLESVKRLARALVQGEKVGLGELPRQMPKRGVYLFSSREGRDLYVGRTNNLKRRIRQHCSGTHRQAAYAFKMARRSSGNTRPSYRPEGSREALAKDPVFAKKFEEAAEEELVHGSSDKTRLMCVRISYSNCAES